MMDAKWQAARYHNRMPHPEITTERLLLRRWRAEDLDPYAALCGDPEVMRWIRNGETLTRKDCAEAIAGYKQAWKRDSFGRFAVEHFATGRFIGFVALSIPDWLPEIMPAVEIGFRFSRDMWRQGLATEGGRAVLRFGFETVGLERIVGVVQIGNAGSARIMTKLGMAFERETVEPRSGRRVRVYGTSAAKIVHASPQ